MTVVNYIKCILLKYLTYLVSFDTLSKFPADL